MREKKILIGMSAEFNYPSQYIDILGSKIHYIEQGSGDPILFLHGIPTSSYIWRNVIPFLAPLSRCIAPDLIGMGKSDRPNIVYMIENYIEYIEQFIEAKKLKNITLVMHGWGSVIGFDYAMRHESNCKGLVFYEAFLKPLQGNDISLLFKEQLHELEALEKNIDLLADASYFFDTLLPQTMMSYLSHEELKHYREPLMQEGEMRSGVGKILKQYLLELPRGDGRSKIDHLIATYSKKLTQSALPKLLLYSVPGFITTIATVMWAKDNLPHLEVGDLGEEFHFAQESRPQLMGELISAWLQGVEREAHV